MVRFCDLYQQVLGYTLPLRHFSISWEYLNFRVLSGRILLLNNNWWLTLVYKDNVTFPSPHTSEANILFNAK